MLLDERTLALHRDATVFLGYVNPACHYRKDAFDYSWFTSDDPRVQGSSPRMRQGGVDVAALSFGVICEATGPADEQGNASGPLWGPLFPEAEHKQYFIRHLDGLRREMDRHTDEMAPARSTADIRRINGEGKLAVMLHMTGAWVNHDLAVLGAYHRLGVRGIHIAVEGLKGVADSSDDEPEFGGLSHFGKDLVREMNRLSMVIDVSHAADSTVRDVLELTDDPIIASHSNARALCDINRNLPDELIRGVAEKGGVVGLHFASGMIERTTQTDRAADDFLRGYLLKTKALMQQHPDPYDYLAHRFSYEHNAADFEAPPDDNPRPPPASLAKLVDHIDYLVNLVGIDHVGIGSDYDLSDIPEELNNASKLPNLTAELLCRRYSDEDIKKIWGGNFMRVYEQVIGE